MQARKVCFFALCWSLTIKYIFGANKRQFNPAPYVVLGCNQLYSRKLFSSYIPLIISRVYTEIVNLASKPSQKLYESLILAQDERWRRV